MGLLDKLIVWTMPWVPKIMVRQIARRYIAGESLAEALDVVRHLNRDGYLCTLDVLGEFVKTPEEAKQAALLYHEILTVLAQEGLQANVSVKPTQMGLLLDKTLCYEILRELVATAQTHHNFVRVEMEDSQCTRDTIEIYLHLRQEFTNVGIVTQAYLRRSLADIRQMIAMDAGHFRLCKGIYIEPRRLAYQDKALINKNYRRLLEEMFKHQVYVGIATHDEALVWEAQRLIEQYQRPQESYEFQMLLGVDPELRTLIRESGHRLRVYVPFGKQWHAYCLRRIRENPKIGRYILENFLHRLGRRWRSGWSGDRHTQVPLKSQGVSFGEL